MILTIEPCNTFAFKSRVTLKKKKDEKSGYSKWMQTGMDESNKILETS